jgi:dihydropteroate synthase
MRKNNTSFAFNWPNTTLDFNTPKIMGIVNVTPDSFYDGGVTASVSKSIEQLLQMHHNGADIIDIGGQSTRPNATKISAQEELDRIALTIEGSLQYNKELIISVDTFYSYVAKNVAKLGAKIINDISAGNMDSEMLSTIAKLQIPYIAMQMKGTPETMQKNPNYANVSDEIIQYFEDKIKIFNHLGITQFAIDPGFGFGKTLQHNYELLKNLNQFTKLECPILVGLSRKSLITKALNISASEALNGTSALHMVALQNGANILRVHDVKEAKEVVELYTHLNK